MKSMMSHGSENEIILRKAEAADAEIAAYTHTVAWQQSYRGIFGEEYLQSKSAKVREQEFLKRIDQGKYHDYLIMEKQEPIGILFLEEDDKNGMEIDSLYIIESYRNSGAGTKAVEFAVNIAKKSEKREIFLWTLLCNKKAGKFYERNAFRTSGEKRMIYRGEAFAQIKYSRSLHL